MRLMELNHLKKEDQENVFLKRSYMNDGTKYYIVLRTAVCKRPDEKTKERKNEWIQKEYKKALKDVKKQKNNAFKSSSKTSSDE